MLARMTPSIPVSSASGSPNSPPLSVRTVLNSLRKSYVPRRFSSRSNELCKNNYDSEFFIEAFFGINYYKEYVDYSAIGYMRVFKPGGAYRK